MTKFAVGQRWRLKPEWVAERETQGRKETTFDFVILGPPGMEWNNPKTNKTCRLEVPGHTEKCGPICSHGIVQDYSHAHLKKYAYLVEEK